MRGLAVFDGELQQDQAFAGIAELGAGIEVDTQLLVGFEEGEIGETGGVGQRHARGDQLPARVVGEVLIVGVFAVIDFVRIVVG